MCQVEAYLHCWEEVCRYLGGQVACWLGGRFSLRLTINRADQLILQLSFLGLFPERYFHNATITIMYKLRLSDWIWYVEWTLPFHLNSLYVPTQRLVIFAGDSQPRSELLLPPWEAPALGHVNLPWSTHVTRAQLPLTLYPQPQSL